jgi:hypothetical protein
MSTETTAAGQIANISPFYIPSTMATLYARRVLKDGDSLAVLDEFGNVSAMNAAVGIAAVVLAAIAMPETRAED